MRAFTCPHCGWNLTFENSVCLGCHSPLGFSLAERTLVVIGGPEVMAAEAESGGVVPADKYRLCDNLHIANCNWLVAAESGDGSPALCESCRLTRTRPNEADDLSSFADAEAAKRRLILELTELGLPIVGRWADPERGLAFDLLSSAADQVVTGHLNGVITVDLAEAHDVHRERLRVEMAEPYRTLLGHFRHEIGHYYFSVLVDDGALDRFRELFGDPFADYQQALDRHYSEGAPAGWTDHYVSSYATMHAAEDWAETFAHYLHIRDTLDTAAAYGFAPAGAALDRPQLGRAGFDRIIELWLPLSWSLNMINRSMGHHDLYPFVLADAVLDKMRFIHDLCARRPAEPEAVAEPVAPPQPADPGVRPRRSRWRRRSAV
ncbi:zinc-binding metallopeptidase family protein [Nocardia sp. alder85J]|uniref:zinc-binding metallopeptidase family protein n=1 Tax=Nocardia sp. alder85J TaxID=2862949 RepID=UPI001CD76D75|nr:putative zinc-binding metallopeptidase [Nocardia sp. alder85J]MCX4093728.1 putative zinc-binding metallopeptidase [Nocardia sp. alder85J]